MVLIMDKKWFLIGVIVGFVSMFSIEVIAAFVLPVESAEDFCYNSTWTAQEYESCISDLR